MPNYRGSKQRRSQGGLKGLNPPLSHQNIDVYFLIFHQHWSRDGVHCRISFSSTARRSNTSVIKPGDYAFSRCEKYWSSFLHSCVVCTTVCSKSWVYRALLALKQAWYLNYQQCSYVSAWKASIKLWCLIRLSCLITLTVILQLKKHTQWFSNPFPVVCGSWRFCL